MPIDKALSKAARSGAERRSALSKAARSGAERRSRCLRIARGGGGGLQSGFLSAALSQFRALSFGYHQPHDLALKHLIDEPIAARADAAQAAALAL